MFITGKWDLPYPMCSMVLEYLPTWLGHKYGVNVGKYSSTMEHLGIPVTYSVARITKTRCRLTPGKNRKDQLERSSRPIVSCPSPTHLWFFGKPRNKSTSWELLGFLCSYETLGQKMELSKTKRLIELC